ncbi:MAG: acyl-CoA synthetase [Microbacterium sp.]|nr:acyl-CoA synthetase [Microbacterium sp.]
MSATARTFTVRHVQLARALFAAAAALMITFSPDHSAAVGLSVFSGFALTTGLLLALSAWLVLPEGRRWPYVLLAVVDILAGMATGIPPWRTDDVFFVVVIAWALIAGLIELLAGLRLRRENDKTARDAISVGAFGLLLGVLLLLIPARFAQPYAIAGAGDFVLTGIILGVGMLGGYAAIVAVFLGIAGLTPKKADAVVEGAETGESAPTAAHGGER